MTEHMSRPIKFRAWDGQQMHYPEVVTIGVSGWNGKTSVSFQPSELGGGSITTSMFMQWTGLHDKDGKEIYEGDIVAEFNGLKGTIVFKDCMFLVEWTRPNFMPMISCLSNIEVIGSVHQNPELLEEKP